MIDCDAECAIQERNRRIAAALDIDQPNVTNDVDIIYPESVIRFALGKCRRGFLKISQFLELILTEHIDVKNSLVSKLQIYYICSIRTFLQLEIQSKLQVRDRPIFVF